MKDSELVWSSEFGDMRKNKSKVSGNIEVDESKLTLTIRRLTSGKGRTIMEITSLPNNKKWCQKLCKDLKKSLGVGGAFKNEMIEIHTKEYDKLVDILSKKGLKFKKIGG